MNTAKLITLGLLRGSGAVDTSASFTVTTTGAQTLNFGYLLFSGNTTFDWGDGSSDVYTGGGARSHNYAGAGVWTVRILEPLNVTIFGSTDAKVTAFPGASLSRMTNIVNLTLSGAGIQWAVSAAEPMPAALNQLSIATCANMSWTISPSSPVSPLLTVLSISNCANIHYTSGLEACNKLGTAYLQNNSFSAVEVNAILLDLYTAAATKTANLGTITLDGNNAAPTGTYAATCPPLTGKAAAYELVNDSCGVIAAGKEWAAVVVTGGLP